MIKSVTFDLHGDHNYLLERQTKDVLRKGKTREQYEKALYDFEHRSHMETRRFYNKYDLYEHFYDTVDDGYKNEAALKNLKDRTIEFSSDKINLIYGPNASGKSTILKAIAARTMCGNDRNLDGFTNPLMFQPIYLTHKLGDYPYDMDSEHKLVFKSQEAFDAYTEALKDKLDKMAGNGITLDWDGSLVYYENFAGRTVTGTVDDFVGTVMGGFGEAAMYFVESGSISLGQKTMWLFMKVLDVINSGRTTADALKEAEEFITKETHSPTWYSTHKVQIEYLKSLYKPESGGKEINTYMFDEIDKSLDITNVIGLYKNILPQINKNENVQIIVISHNPIVLSSLLNPDDYNIISVDEEYTEEVRKLLDGITFKK